MKSMLVTVLLSISVFTLLTAAPPSFAQETSGQILGRLGKLSADNRQKALVDRARNEKEVMFYSSLQVVDAGFALTFGATFGILAGMSKVADVLPASSWLRAPAALLIASACAEIAPLLVKSLALPGCCQLVLLARRMPVSASARRHG